MIAAIEAGGFSAACDVYAPDVVLDATVPGWRFKVAGEQGVRDEYGRWFAVPAELVELDRHHIFGGEVVEYFMTWTQGGVVHGAHHLHLLTVDGTSDRISADHVFCGGRWPASLLAEMNAPTFVPIG